MLKHFRVIGSILDYIGINSSILLELRERLLLFTDELLVEKLIVIFIL